MSENLTQNPDQAKLIDLPILPLRDVVVFPQMVVPLFVGRKRSINTLETAMTAEKMVVLVAQKNPANDDPDESDLYNIGTLATVLQMLKLPDGTVKVLVEGERRVRIKQFIKNEEIFLGEIEYIQTQPIEEREAEILMRSALALFDQYIKMHKKIPAEVLNTLSGINDPEKLVDTIAAHLSIKIEDKQQLLEIVHIGERLERLMGYLEGEMEVLQVEKKIRGRVKRQMEKSQREYYLNEQIKAIQKELGELNDEDGEGGGGNELEQLARKIDNAGMSKESKEKALNELKKLRMMSPMSAEATVIRNYLDWLINVPWKKRSKIRYNLSEAEKILEQEHYGLEKVKERIVEYLAVQQRVKQLRGPILCLVGPPGVGKTSLAASIAKATGRKFIRMSLGGVRDEAEIRGHRRTYIGALPGKIIQKLAKAEVRNPLYLLDEVDKMAMDFRGDPASALLEVLDPEQNHAFSDHYLEVDYDLSEVMFIATANTLNIPEPLLDRMEVIRLSGYTEDEKVHIALKHLIPLQMEKNGLRKSEVIFSETALRDMIRYYTREAGVRSLDREISKICRKVVKQVLVKPKEQVAITSRSLEKYLGVKRYRFGRAEEHNQVGQVNGLAWTEVGGELLTIEAAAVQGKGKAIYTGHLGEVMQESIQAAMTVVRSRSIRLGIAKSFYENTDIHVHVPEGATPKDGPSAGIGMCTALVSVLTDIPVKADVAMTGEITLRGEVLPIGGLKEKLLAAHRAGIKNVIIPSENKRDLKEIPANIQKDLIIHPVRWIDEVLNLALERMPAPLSEEEKAMEDEDIQVAPAIQNTGTDAQTATGSTH